MNERMPNGPQALSLDIGFGKFDNLFGIPERINSFKVNKTVKYTSKEYN